jgi:excisionase family DNA binding protein
MDREGHPEEEMRVGLIRERLLQHVSEVLQNGSVDEVFVTSDQLRVVAGALAALPSDEDVDLSAYTIDTTQAARMLSYHAEHVRRLIRQRTIRATKVGADYRIPLSEIFAVLVRRDHEEATPTLLPSPRPEPPGDSLADGNDLELAIDILVTRGRERRTTRLQRVNIDLGEFLGERAGGINGEPPGMSASDESPG